MAIDYVIFVHGVNVRDPGFANKLIRRIGEHLPNHPNEIRYVPLYWGDVVKAQLDGLRIKIKRSPLWDQLWFRDFRDRDLLRFAGDAALYISRHVGFETVETLAKQAVGQVSLDRSGDRLHLVTHSWGTVILFDILFAPRWEAAHIPPEERKLVQAIRDLILCIGPNRDKGLRLASISTMGSPILLFNLINSQPNSSHNITADLRSLLENSAKATQPIPWMNFVHPGDPVAWPLEVLLPELVGHFADVADIPTRGGALDVVGWTLQSSFLSLINGGSAHGSYFDSKRVAEHIAQAIRKMS